MYFSFLFVLHLICSLFSFCCGIKQLFKKFYENERISKIKMEFNITLFLCMQKWFDSPFRFLFTPSWQKYFRNIDIKFFVYFSFFCHFANWRTLLLSYSIGTNKQETKNCIRIIICCICSELEGCVFITFYICIECKIKSIQIHFLKLQTNKQIWTTLKVKMKYLSFYSCCFHKKVSFFVLYRSHSIRHFYSQSFHCVLVWFFIC